MPVTEVSKQSIAAYNELGVVGLKHYGGQIHEDFVPKLRSRRSRIMEYKKMMDDSVVGAVLFAIEMHMKTPRWHVKPASEDAKDKEIAEFVEDCFKGMSHTFADFLSEVLSMLPFGFSLHEIVYRLRDDGRIGWKKLPIRSQDSIDSWDFDDKDGIKGANQLTDKGHTAYIPIEKALLFRASSYKNNPEGRSVLRGAYRPYYFKSKLEIVEAIGIERDLSGYPVLNVPMDVFADNDLARAKLNLAKTMVSRVRKDEQMGSVMPPGWELELLSSKGSGKTNAGDVISRYSIQIAQSLLSDVIMLGHARSGSYALSEQKYELFVVAIDSWLDSVAEVFNRYAIPRLLALNGFDVSNGIPELMHDPVSKIDPQKLSNVLFRLMKVSALEPDRKMEDYLREFLGLPLKDEDSVREVEGGGGKARTDDSTRGPSSDGDYNQTSSSHVAINA